MSLMIGKEEWCRRYLAELRRLKPDFPDDDCEACAEDVCKDAYGAEEPEHAARAYIEQEIYLSTGRRAD